MPSRAAAFPDVTAFTARAYDARDYRRAIFGGAILGLGSVSAAALMAGTVAVAAAWMVSGSLARNPTFRASAPVALEAAVLPAPPRRLADPPDMFGGALAAANPAYAPPAPSPATAEAAPKQQSAALTNNVPLPSPRPLHLALVRIERERTAPAPAPAFAATPAASSEAREIRIEAAAAGATQKPTETREQKQMAALAASFAAADVTGSISPVANPVFPNPVFPKPALPKPEFPKPAFPRLAYNNPDTPPLRDSRTAIYDIVAHTVYMPDGERLEAHSGLGRMLDDPRYVAAKGRGPTPPNTYDLTLRSGMFHGVQALRLNPVADSRMYGRDGILAHTYMLGPSGQSFGCVSFKNYAQFLRAFRRGDVSRLVVVPHLPSPPPGVRAGNDAPTRYAFDIQTLH